MPEVVICSKDKPVPEAECILSSRDIGQVLNYVLSLICISRNRFQMIVGEFRSRPRAESRHYQSRCLILSFYFQIGAPQPKILEI